MKHRLFHTLQSNFLWSICFQISPKNLTTFLLFGLLAINPRLGWAGCTLEIMEVPVRIINWRPIATLTINGVKVPMLVESGTTFSSLSLSAATELKLPIRNLPIGITLQGYTGAIAAKLTSVEKVKLADAELSNVDFIVGGSELGEGIMGVLGRNILAKGDTEYDLAHGVVRLIFPKGDCKKANFAYWAGDAPIISVPLINNDNPEDSSIRVDVRVNGKRDQALLNSGSTKSALTLKAARRAGIAKSDLVSNGRVRGAGEGSSTSWISNVTQIEIGEERINNVELSINDVEEKFEGLVLGLDYFLSHRIYVSRLQNQLYATWNGVPVFTRARALDGQYDAKYAALPSKVDDNDTSALARRGSAATVAGNFDRALADLNQAITLAPKVAEYRYLRALTHLAMRHHDQALIDFNEALLLDPAHDEARFQRAYLHLSVKDKQGSLADLKQLDDTLPTTSHKRVDMANLYTFLNLTPEAFKQLDLWISSHPNDNRLASALNSRCWLRARLNIELSLALQDCKDAVKKDDDNSAYHDSLGWTYLRLGDAAQAKKAFDNALENELSPVSQYGRAIAKLKLNDAKGAEADFAKARAKEPKIDEKIRQYGFTFVEEGKPSS